MTLDVLHVDRGNDDSNLILHNKFLLPTFYPQVLVSSFLLFFAENGKKLVFIPHDNSNLPINNNNWCATLSLESETFSAFNRQNCEQ
jgi:hypothetical protein